MKRRHRTPDELQRIFAEHSSVEALYRGLGEIENVIVQPDGTGSVVFKAYVSGRMDSYEGFFWGNTSLEKCYVKWKHQGEDVEGCRELWGPLVKSPSNPDGSELRRGVNVETVLRIAKEYADLTSS